MLSGLWPKLSTPSHPQATVRTAAFIFPGAVGADAAWVVGLAALGVVVLGLRRRRSAPTREAVPGTATFLFTDIENYTVHWERLGKRFGPVKEAHDRLLRALATRHHGHEVVTTGDGFFFVFPTGSLAIEFSITLQAVARQDSGLVAALGPVTEMLPNGIKVRVGMHSGERVETDPGTYDGPNTNKAARICGAGHGGQILLSEETYREARLNLSPETTCLDLGQYRLKGISEDVLIFQVVDPRLPERQFPRLNASTPDRVHLPRFLTPFLGRQEDVERLQRLLTEEQRRLIVLVGPGGVGKTRLSVQAAEGVAERYPDGVWFVDLDSAATPGDIFARLVLRLPLSSENEAEPDDRRVANYLAGKTLLLVLDNLEQIERPEDALRALLDSSPTVQCLASSRDRVLLNGTQTYSVPPLAVPGASGSDPEALQTVESVRFFVERARSHDQDFTLTPENAASVAALCRQLEGIPLSLELAAAGTTQMTPAEIVTEIKTHLDLLQSGYDDLPERQRTVRASIDWSYGRLQPPEKLLFARLAVFEGGLTREAAAAVGDPETPELLRRLTEKSLLKRHESQGRTRYRLLNTTKLYAGEQLAALEDAAAVRERHARFYARTAQERLTHLRTDGELEALQALEDETDNLKAALRWSWDVGQFALCGDLALALGAFLERRGRHREARPYVQQGLDALAQSGDADSPVYAALLRARAGLALDAFDYDDARADAARLLALSRAQGRPLGVGQAHNLLGIADRSEKLHADAAAHFRAALSCFQEQGEASAAAAAQNNLGVTLMEDPSGDKAEAQRLLNETLALRRAGGDRRGTAEVLTNLGNLAEASHDFDAAGRYYAEALAGERERRDTFGIARALSNLGEVAEAQGRLAQAARLYAAGQHLFGRVNSPYQSYTQGLLDRLAAQHPSAYRSQAASFQAATEKSEDALVAWAVGDEPQAPA